MVEVVATDEFTEWYRDLDAEEQSAIEYLVGLLEHLGGNKKGDDRFYERMLPLAERIWEQYLREQAH